RGWGMRANAETCKTDMLPFEVLFQPEESGLSKSSKVQAQQVRTISKERIVSELLGSLSEDSMQSVDAALKLHLALEN
ncbi:MAG: type II toxin-antitoxin system PemK/MazF family toxin, partial [Oscillatoriales cyanobacterium C42_A2020_001]|nr:type II toxin-antitoxin system PemK/MazF family toxin [Leptolyngbyaceae cyanobacterium C42_A2020_001]